MQSQDPTERAKEIAKQLKPFLPSFLEGMERDKYKRVICPLCGSGKGPKETSAVQESGGVKWYCHSCGKGGDIVDFYQAIHGGTWAEAVKTLAERYLGHYQTTPPPRPLPKKPSSLEASKAPEALLKAQAAYPGSEGERYMLSRGISTETAKAFGLGYDMGAQRVIIPTANGSTVGRAITEEAKPKYMANGKRELFNLGGLNQGGAVFITEGELDALSLLEAGYNAVGIGGTSGVKALVEALEAVGEHNQPFLLLALDNDKKGEEAQAKLTEALTEKGYKGFKALEAVGGLHPLYQEAKDANEALIKAPERLTESAEALLEGFARVKSIGERLGSIADKMRESAKVIPISLEAFANALPRKGFTKGLYLLGASPAKGKSALCQQLAEGAAKQGHKVLYFAFEMSEDELLLRSIIRHRAEEANEALSAEKAEAAFLAGKSDLMPPKEVLQNVYIEDFETKEPTLETVARVLRQFLALRHKKLPLVVVDYLQLIQLSDKRENADTVTRLQTVALELKRLSRNCPFLVISSLNREGRKDDKPRLESFQGSGSLEYTANWAGILWDLEMPKDTPPLKGGKRLALHCVKVRSGVARNTVLTFRGSQYRFTDPGEPLERKRAK